MTDGALTPDEHLALDHAQHSRTPNVRIINCTAAEEA